MSPPTDLERRCRRLLALYPREFRREHGQEMLAVLLSGARPDQRRPDRAESLALLRGAVHAWLRPASGRRVPMVVSYANRMLCLAAALELVALVVVSATQGSVRAAVLHANPAAHWHTVAQAHILSLQIGAPIVAALWLLTAWGSVRGHGWAWIAAILLQLLNSVSLFSSLTQNSFVLAPLDAAVGCALWVAGLSAVVLLLSPRAAAHYGRPGAQ